MRTSHLSWIPLTEEPEVWRKWLDQSLPHLTEVMHENATHTPLPPPPSPPSLSLHPAEDARPLSDALTWLQSARRHGLQTAAPGNLAYIPGSGLFASALAGFLSLAMNRFTAMTSASPELSRLEPEIIRFLCNEMGLPSTSGGFLSSGGSIANLSALITARHTQLGEDTDLRRATLYTSDQSHHSVTKAARLAGIPTPNVRLIPTDSAYRLLPDALRDTIQADRDTGYRPFLIVATAGTTHVGAIDPLNAIADIASDAGLWLHVDAAYGGAFVLADTDTPETAAALEEIHTKLAPMRRADSITLDPHKGLFVPYGVGCLLVRDTQTLRDTHAIHAAYLQDLDSDSAPLSASELGPELSRNERALLLWLPFWLHGVRAFREALASKIALTRRFDAAIQQRDLTRPLAPELSIVSFHCTRRPGEALDTLNARTRALLDAINAPGDITCSSTLLRGPDGPIFTIRACFLSFRTGATQVDRLLAYIDAHQATQPG